MDTLTSTFRIRMLALALAVPALAWGGAAVPKAMRHTASLITAPTKPTAPRTATPLEYDDARREIRTTLADPEIDAGQPVSAAVQRSPFGRLVVVNHSYDYVDVYVSLNDRDTPWVWVGTLPPRYRLRVKLRRGYSYVVAADTAGEDDGFDWSPTSFYLRGKYVWTLLP